MRLNEKKPLLPRLIGCCLMLIIGCSDLPKDIHRQPSTVISDGHETALGREFDSQRTGHPGQSGVFLLSHGLDAFVGRALLASLAERSIDVQYYMFHQDTVGKLLIDQLLKAADRGVRVRMLIDDIYGDEADDVWTALDAHPKMEVRLFNPFVRGCVQESAVDHPVQGCQLPHAQQVLYRGQSGDHRRRPKYRQRVLRCRSESGFCRSRPSGHRTGRTRSVRRLRSILEQRLCLSCIRVDPTRYNRAAEQPQGTNGPCATARRRPPHTSRR